MTFLFSISWCTFHWLQLRKLFLFPISLRNLQTFCFILFVGSWPELPQHPILYTFSSAFCCIVASFSCTVFNPGLPSNPAHRFSIRFLLCSSILFCACHICASFYNEKIDFTAFFHIDTTNLKNIFLLLQQALADPDEVIYA